MFDNQVIKMRSAKAAWIIRKESTGQRHERAIRLWRRVRKGATRRRRDSP